MNSFLISENGLLFSQLSGGGMGALTQLDAECSQYSLSLRADHHLS
jgi:hypothetical protein